ncbi:hypothetical protein PHYSODRAFT_325360 [Phytophthora sojae]|uniref:Uncharacterized protein n=1 Tax=Phytophthora sojae (strain P6497) TaxID=1094619 RepID=G4YSU8_PHYSP|nr:hypothetical protein PHYSODRAFT_325360 [Phytophthora sojae]EGZ24220.1 hypothetical protein PHYSODRAFT_325360 [Phytophthora sojae]|eukprot:XP_009519508.1 hypothetical protein PHYSODRAFT_325360 [Phytophthora sojae]
MPRGLRRREWRQERCFINMCQAAKRPDTSITRAGAKLLRRYFADYGIPANELANMAEPPEAEKETTREASTVWSSGLTEIAEFVLAQTRRVQSAVATGNFPDLDSTGFPRRDFLDGISSTGFPRRGFGLTGFGETGALVDPSDGYASHWILAPCLTAHHPRRLSRRARPCVAPINTRRVLISRVEVHHSRPPTSISPSSSGARRAHFFAGHYTTTVPLPRTRTPQVGVSLHIMVRAEDIYVEEGGPDTGNLETAGIVVYASRAHRSRLPDPSDQLAVAQAASPRSNRDSALPWRNVIKRSNPSQLWSSNAA